MSLYCYCGHKLGLGVKFCANCGTPAGGKPQSQPQTSTEQAPRKIRLASEMRRAAKNSNETETEDNGEDGGDIEEMSVPSISSLDVEVEYDGDCDQIGYSSRSMKFGDFFKQ